jgi:hypothetical protein
MAKTAKAKTKPAAKKPVKAKAKTAKAKPTKKPVKRKNPKIGECARQMTASARYHPVSAWASKIGQTVPITACKDVPEIGKELAKFTAKIKGCYENAWRVAKKHGIKIVIGQTLAIGRIAIDHAWNVTDDGIHFDVTLRNHEDYFAIRTCTVKEYESIVLGHPYPLGVLFAHDCPKEYEKLTESTGKFKVAM